MKPSIHTMSPIAILRHPWLLATLAMIAFLGACGGGSGTVAGDVGSGGTGAAVSGPIRGFGSVIVDGIRFDDSSATITLDDDGTARRDEDLRLGMVVGIEGERFADGVTGKATSITGRSFVQGPIWSINPAGGTLTVLGVTVTVSPDTVFDGAGVTSLGSLAVNDSVEIYGIADGAGLLKATRIEKIAKDEVRLTGTAQNADPNTFMLGGITVSYKQASLPNLQGSVPNGMLVRVKGKLSSPTAIDASEVRSITLGPAIAEGKFIGLDGLVTRFVSPDDFDVNGLKVSVPGNAQGGLALGARVEVEGVAMNNQLLATKVEVKNEQQDKAEDAELHGPIFAADTANRTFTMRGGTVTVKWDDNTEFDDGLTPADLVQGQKLEVKGRTAGNILIATRIKRD